MNDPTDSRDAAHQRSKPPVKQQQQKESYVKLTNLRIMQFSFDTRSVDIKETLLIRRGFRWNTRTKYQAKSEGVRGAVVPVED